jgi:hypothetical protein
VSEARILARRLLRAATVWSALEAEQIERRQDDAATYLTVTAATLREIEQRLDQASGAPASLVQDAQNTVGALLRRVEAMQPSVGDKSGRSAWEPMRSGLVDVANELAELADVLAVLRRRTDVGAAS